LNLDGYFCHIRCLGNLGEDIDSTISVCDRSVCVWEHHIQSRFLFFRLNPRHNIHQLFLRHL